MCKIAEIPLRGNKSKRLILNVTERFRCQCLTSGRFRCFLSFGVCVGTGQSIMLPVAKTNVMCSLRALTAIDNIRSTVVY